MRKDKNTKILNDRFMLRSTKNEDEYIMYLDDKLIGEEYKKKYGFNSIDEKSNLNILCDFTQIAHLKINNLLKNSTFYFSDQLEGLIDEDKLEIANHLYLYDIACHDNELLASLSFSVDLTKFDSILNPVLIVSTFCEKLKNLKNIKVGIDGINDGFHNIDFDYVIKNEEDNLNIIIQNISSKITFLYNEVLNSYKNNKFEATFNFPGQYQSMLKPYLLYFEEFLNDLCIKTDVNIQKIGLDTVLSVEPKNKDEALDKIADALKAYLCAPVISNGITVEESLQMQISLTKLNAQCKHLESQMILKELSLREQNQQIELNDTIINESKRILIDAGVDTSIITQNNTMLLESLKSIKINGKQEDKKTFLNSIKASINVFKIFSGSLELNRKEFDKEN